MSCNIYIGPALPSMQSEASGDIQTPEDSVSQSNKRRRTSEQPPDSGHVLPAARRTLTTSSPQLGGSSREMTPPEGTGSTKYTRTGRVSKATKGQRVHHCDECGKVSCKAPTAVDTRHLRLPMHSRSVNLCAYLSSGLVAIVFVWHDLT